MDESYNDIQTWKFKDLVAAFGADPKKSKTFQVKTKQEADDLLNDKEFSSAPYLQVGPPSSVTEHPPDTNSDAVCRTIHAQGRRSCGLKADGGSVSEDQC